MRKAVLVLAGAAAVAAALPAASFAGGPRVGVSIAIGGPPVAFFPPPPVVFFPPPPVVYYAPPPVAFFPRPYYYAPPTVVFRSGGRPNWGHGNSGHHGQPGWGQGYGGHRARY